MKKGTFPCGRNKVTENKDGKPANSCRGSEVEGKAVGSRGNVCLDALGVRVLMPVEERRKGPGTRRSRMLLGDLVRKPGIVTEDCTLSELIDQKYRHLAQPNLSVSTCVLSRREPFKLRIRNRRPMPFLRVKY